MKVDVFFSIEIHDRVVIFKEKRVQWSCCENVSGNQLANVHSTLYLSQAEAAIIIKQNKHNNVVQKHMQK